MADSWKSENIEVYVQWADYILNHGKDVSLWEQGFVKDIRKTLNLKNLSQKQAEILERIYAEKT